MGGGGGDSGLLAVERGGEVTIREAYLKERYDQQEGRLSRYVVHEII